MKNRSGLSLALVVSLSMLMAACGESSSTSSKSAPAPRKKTSTPTNKSGFTESTAPDEKTSEEAQPEAPVYTGPKVADYPSEITLELIEKSGLSFEEAITLKFTRYSNFFSRNLYVYEKSYIGEDNLSWLWWQQGDDVNWTSPWSVISIDLITMRVLGGTQAGLGIVIGYVQYDGQNFKMEISAPYLVDKELQSVAMYMPAQPTFESGECPQTVKAAGLCDLYSGIFETLGSIDYSAFGEAGPGIASDVVSFEAAFGLATSFFSFDPDINSIRKEYLVPMLKAIGQLKALKNADQSDHDVYLQQTRKTYSNLIITSVDTVLKTQKMMPEAVANVGHSSLGVLLAYIGLNGVGDAFIASKQPAWFKELIAPIIREFGVLSLDLILNGSNTPLQQRIDRFVAMEAQVRDAVQRLCKESPTAQSECTEALNQ